MITLISILKTDTGCPKKSCTLANLTQFQDKQHNRMMYILPTLFG